MELCETTTTTTMMILTKVVLLHESEYSSRFFMEHDDSRPLQSISLHHETKASSRTSNLNEVVHYFLLSKFPNDLSATMCLLSLSLRTLLALTLPLTPRILNLRHLMDSMRADMRDRETRNLRICPPSARGFKL